MIAEPLVPVAVVVLFEAGVCDSIAVRRGGNRKWRGTDPVRSVERFDFVKVLRAVPQSMISVRGRFSCKSDQWNKRRARVLCSVYAIKVRARRARPTERRRAIARAFLCNERRAGTEKRRSIIPVPLRIAAMCRP